MTSETTKRQRMCRKCLPQVHLMKECPSYNRGRQRNKKRDSQNTSVNSSGAVDASSQPSAPTSSNDPGLQVIGSENASPFDTPGPPLPQESSSQAVAAANEFSDIPIDPALSALPQPLFLPSPQSSPFQTPRRQRSASVGSMNLLDRHDSPSHSSASSSVTPSSVSSTPSRRERASKKKPIFGHVTGVYRGTRHLSCFRTRQAINPGKIRTLNVPKRFYDRTRSLMTKLKDLATETGCWLYFNAQLPTSQHPFIHYTSERLRSEGGDLMDSVHQASKRMYSSLQAARRRDASQIAADLETARDELTRAKEAEEAALKKAEEYRTALEAAGINIV
ncbi:hypothetical protein VNI00_017666 [Paramarasmius palmivorus]|uniref:Uncharacterized protein n=1 Tax=Paramarasmius palmivorus TaxID=297713 RepID=A0AAW0B5X8_9AGAR